MKGQKHNSVSQSERKVSTVRGYYQGSTVIIPEKDALVDFGDYINGILKGLAKPYAAIH